MWPQVCTFCAEHKVQSASTCQAISGELSPISYNRSVAENLNHTIAMTLQQLHLLRVLILLPPAQQILLPAAGRVLGGHAGLPYSKQCSSGFLCSLLFSLCMVLKAFSAVQCCSSCQTLPSFGRCIFCLTLLWVCWLGWMLVGSRVVLLAKTLT